MEPHDENAARDATYFHPGQRRAVGMPFSACSMCKPHPAHVINPHVLQRIERHIAPGASSYPPRAVLRQACVTLSLAVPQAPGAPAAPRSGQP